MADPESHPDPGDPAAPSHARLRAVLDEVWTLPEEQREVAITRLCAGDAPLAAQVRSLTDADRALPDTFLAVPALGAPIVPKELEPGPAPDALIGATLGPYIVEARIASGGMGTVYRAARADGQFVQRVAIKVVKRGMDSEDILRRFASERRNLAALDHPNIARLLDAGLMPDGRPFLAMELVEGEPLDAYCDAHAVPVRGRLMLFRAVCDAVHAAHAALVVHRDIKPANILVNAQGVPKLVDFGIAKVLSSDAPGSGTASLRETTAERDRRLTPEYASPEQVAGGHLTTASDVYSLGVVLYELLCGCRPYDFETKSPDEVRRVVCTQVPDAPSVAVTRPASRREPSDVPTAEPTTIARARVRAATRARSTGRLRGVLRGDLDTIVLMALRKEPARRYASAEQLSADIGRYLAGQPVSARKDTLTYRAQKFVRRHAAGTTVTVLLGVLLLGSAVALWQQNRRIRAQQAVLGASNASLAGTNAFLEDVLLGAGDTEQGPNATLGDVLDSAASALASDPPKDPDTRAAAQRAVGRTLARLGRFDEAQALLDTALSGASAGQSPSHPSVLAARMSLAELSLLRGQHAQAEARFRAVLGLLRACVPLPEADVADAQSGLGAALRLQRKFAEAESVQREALALRLTLDGPESLRVAESRNNLGGVLVQQGKLDEGLSEYEQSLAVRRAKLRPDHPMVVRMLHNIGLTLVRADRAAEAVPMLKKASDAWPVAFGEQHPGVALSLIAHGIALRKLTRYEDAIARFERARDWQSIHLGKDAPASAATDAHIAIVWSMRGEHARSVPVLRASITVLEKSPAEFAAILTQGRTALASSLEALGQADDAAAERAKIK